MIDIIAILFAFFIGWIGNHFWHRDTRTGERLIRDSEMYQKGFDDCLDTCKKYF